MDRYLHQPGLTSYDIYIYIELLLGSFYIYSLPDYWYRSSDNSRQPNTYSTCSRLLRFTTISSASSLQLGGWSQKPIVVWVTLEFFNLPYFLSAGLHRTTLILVFFIYMINLHFILQLSTSRGSNIDPQLCDTKKHAYSSPQYEHHVQPSNQPSKPSFLSSFIPSHYRSLTL